MNEDNVAPGNNWEMFQLVMWIFLWSPRKNMVKDGTVSFLAATTGDFFAKHTWPCPPDGKNNLFKLFRHQLHSLKLTANAPAKRKRSSSNHSYSGANSLLVSGRVEHTHTPRFDAFVWYITSDKTHKTHIGGLPVKYRSIKSSYSRTEVCNLIPAGP